MSGSRPTVKKTVVVAMIIIVIILGIGFATYLLGSPGKSEVAPGAVKIPFVLASAPAPIPADVASEITLPFDNEGGVAIGRDGFSTLETVFMGSDEVQYVVDHPAARSGARVRGYRDGSLVASHAAPAGSTLFTVVGEGFGYVIAKGQSASERVVVVDRNGSVSATYTVPMELNSGGLVMQDQTLYALAWSGFVDPDTKEVTGEDVLVPVAVGGVQVTDEKAQDAIVEGWRVGAGSEVWRHKLGTVPRPQSADQTRRVLEVADAELEIPYEAIPLGIDPTDRAWVLLPPHKVAERAVAGWPALTDEYSLIVVIAKSGSVEGAMPVRVPQGLFYPDIGPARRVGFDGVRLSIADRTQSGVVITTWKVRP